MELFTFTSSKKSPGHHKSLFQGLGIAIIEIEIQAGEAARNN